MISIRKISKGHNSVKIGGVSVLLSAHRQMVVHICTKFHEHFLDGIEVIEQTRFHRKNFKGA